MTFPMYYHLPAALFYYYHGTNIREATVETSSVSFVEKRIGVIILSNKKILYL
jgi:hypothetical protein